MGLFQKKQVRISKTENSDIVQYFLDYGKLKNPLELILGLIRYLNEGGRCLIVIDSNVIYVQNKKEIEGKIQSIKQKLEEFEIKYSEAKSSEEREYTLLGMRRKSTSKESCYKIGVIVDMDRLDQILPIIADNNALCYLFDQKWTEEEIWDSFVGAKGDNDSLSHASELDLYYDMVFRRIRVQSSSEKAQDVEKKITEYTQEL